MEEEQQVNQQVNAPVRKKELKPEEIAAQFGKLLKSIDEARSNRDRKDENAFYLQARDLFGQIYGEDLFKKAEQEATSELVSEGFNVSGKTDLFSEENISKQVEIFRAQQQTFGLQAGWQSLSEAEKKSYENDMSSFVTDIEKKRNDLKKEGLDVSKEIFYNMIAGGYMFPDIKKGFFSGKIKIPILLGEGAYKFSAVSKKEFENLINALQTLFEMIARQAIIEKINNRFTGGRKRWQERKRRKMREIITRDIEKIEEEKRTREMIELRIQNEVQRRIAQREKDFAQEVEGLKEEEAFKKIESIERSNRKTDQQMKKEIEQITKNLSRDIETIGQEEARIKKIKKQQERKNKTLPKKSAYIKFVAGEVAPGEQEPAEKPDETQPQSQ